MYIGGSLFLIAIGAVPVGPWLAGLRLQHINNVELTGEEIVAMLEENLERTFACDPYDQMGGYVKRGLGFNAYIKIENPPGQRVQQVFAGDDLLQAGRH